MQNKPNFQKAKMNASSTLTKDYENIWQRRVRKNKPNSNPIKPNLKRAQMNVKLTLTKGYRKKGEFSVRINKPNFRNGQNECNLKYNKGLWHFRLYGRRKNKPKQTQFQIGRQKRKNGTFYPAHPTYIKELCKRARHKYTMSCLS